MLPMLPLGSRLCSCFVCCVTFHVDCCLEEVFLRLSGDSYDPLLPVVVDFLCPWWYTYAD